MEYQNNLSECKCKPRMTEEEIARMQLDNEEKAVRSAQDEANDTANSYLTIQVQIATVLIGFLSFGLISQSSDESLLLISFWERVLFFVAFVGLTSSLFFGLATLSNKKEFFVEQARRFQNYFGAWSAYLRGDTTYDHAKSQRRKSTDGKTEWSSKPFFHDVQSVSLVLGVSALLVLIILNLFV